MQRPKSSASQHDLDPDCANLSVCNNYGELVSLSIQEVKVGKWTAIGQGG